MLDDVVHTHFITHRDTSMVTPPFIVLNGVGGLGKSLSAGFLAHQRKYGEVRHYSLIAQNMVTRSFSSIVNEVMSTRTPHSTAIYFDELDKYVDMYTRYAYLPRNDLQMQLMWPLQATLRCLQAIPRNPS